MTDTSGGVTLTQSYDPFGNLNYQTGSGQSVYGFTNEPTDASGLVYLRARYFDPQLGRFINKDPFEGLTGMPQSLNPYVYSLNNPVNYTDPSGNFPWVILPPLGFGALGAAVNITHQLDHNGGNWECIDWWEVGTAFGAGALAGLLIEFQLVVAPTPDLLIDFMFTFNDIGHGNWDAMGLNMLGLAVPAVTGLGQLDDLVRLSSHADEVLSWANRADNLYDIAHSANFFDNADDAKRILVVGENSFEYSLALRSKLGADYHITATSLESYETLEGMGRKWNFEVPESAPGLDILHNVDATRLGDYFAPGSFDTIIFNNPHLAVRTPQGSIDSVLSDRATENLINNFLDTAQPFIKPNGQIEINLTQTLLSGYPNVRELVNTQAYLKRYFYQSDFYAAYIPRYTWGQQYRWRNANPSKYLLNFTFK